MCSFVDERMKFLSRIALTLWKTECFHQAIEDWFHYSSRTFDVQNYERYNKLQDHGGSSKECKQFGDMPEEPQKSDYFPKEPRACSLSEVLPWVAGVLHINGLDVLEKQHRRCAGRKPNDKTPIA
ncbi:hypothetical protein VTN77DRAFT_6967 [Rasamsonia byssochlamydoides]|uniref:uncharacterized protein n=1 Tax=Rasamsonia byssochlamydoides TaxID=89139 RepID=UPI0037445FF6